MYQQNKIHNSDIKKVSMYKSENEGHDLVSQMIIIDQMKLANFY